MRIIEQNAHQLRNRQSRMGIVELDRDLVGKQMPIPIPVVETANEVGKRASNQKVFLKETQFLTDRGAVVGIEHPRQRLRRESSRKRADKIAAAELLKIEKVGRCGRPQSQCVDGLAAIADYRAVKGNADQCRGAVWGNLQAAVVRVYG